LGNITVGILLATLPGTSLRDASGNWVGYLNFHERDTMKSLLAFREGKGVGEKFELVAISQG